MPKKISSDSLPPSFFTILEDFIYDYYKTRPEIFWKWADQLIILFIFNVLDMKN